MLSSSSFGGSELHNDAFVNLFAHDNYTFKLINYIWNKSLISFDSIRQEIDAGLLNHLRQHRKNEAKAKSLVISADEYYRKNDHHSAIKHYSKALRLVPQEIQHEVSHSLAQIYAKRAICLYEINCPREAEFDYRCASYLNVNIGRICLQNAICTLKAKASGTFENDAYYRMLREIFALQSQPPVVVTNHDNHGGVHFNPNILNLWFNNKERGVRHSSGAHFPCAKSNLPLNTVVLEERPFVVVSSELQSTCGGCTKPVANSFWPCNGCDEIVFCSIECQLQNIDHHTFECGFVGYIRTKLSPLANLLLGLYSKSKCRPEYTSRTDLSLRRSLSTDADVYFQDKPNKSRLPKRSYQYRYFSLTNDACKKILLQSNTNDFISQETVLAVRESADNKDDILPSISKTELIKMIVECARLVFAMGFFLRKQNFELSKREDKVDLAQIHRRLVDVIEDYKRLYRLNLAQAFQTEHGQVFALPVVGTFFWPDCRPNVNVTLCSRTQTLVYRTIRNVGKFEKLTIGFPLDYYPEKCQCFTCSNMRVLNN